MLHPDTLYCMDVPGFDATKIDVVSYKGRFN